MTEYGYVRVSHTDQNEVRQMIRMHENGLEDQNIFIDKKSGKDFNRPQYQILYKKLSKGDVILRSEERIALYQEVFDEWNRKRISAKEAARRLGITREAFLRNAGKLQAGYKFKVEKKTKRYG